MTDIRHSFGEERNHLGWRKPFFESQFYGCVVVYLCLNSLSSSNSDSLVSIAVKTVFFFFYVDDLLFLKARYLYL